MRAMILRYTLLDKGHEHLPACLRASLLPDAGTRTGAAVFYGDTGWLLSSVTEMLPVVKGGQVVASHKNHSNFHGESLEVHVKVQSPCVCTLSLNLDVISPHQHPPPHLPPDDARKKK